MEIIKFFLCPNLQKAATQKERLSNAFTALKFTVLSLIIFAVALAVIHLITKGLNFEYSIMDTSKKFNNAIVSRTALEIFVFGTVLIPLLEELTFRAFLDFRKISIALSIGGVTYILAKTMLVTELSAVLAVGGFTISFIALRKSAIEFMRSNFRLLFYLSSISFVCLHAFNYNLPKFIAFDYLVLPILLIPQIIGALSYSFLRIRNGLVWSFLFHSLENMVFFLPSIAKGI